ncbi:uncharacterized protein LOC129610805 isoform X2 [Condylostylus longicornis]|nr:uncharacterized protein LOC129610805 isoform X2 [Condylostylus longicornis]XP_055379507.1 uncharacterized protein LOC129610805 isoform X2 [Condylostylus longicornis]
MEIKSVMTDCVDTKLKVNEQGKIKDQSDSEDINQQNIHNKRSEKLNKPCRDGFCYCFTSDSDQHVHKKKLRTKSRKYCVDSSQSSKCSEENTSQTSDFSEMNQNEFSEYLLSDQKAQKKFKDQRIKRKSNYELQAKATLNKNENAPLIHIVQEIYRDRIISEVKVNEKVFNRKKSLKDKSSNKTKIEYITEKPVEEINCDFEDKYESEVRNQYNLGNYLKEMSEEKNRSGQFLKRRVSENFQNRSTYCNAPPKKPPRRFSENINPSTRTSKVITDFKEAEMILNNFLRQYGRNFEIDDNYVDKLIPSFDKTQRDPKHGIPEIISDCSSFGSESETESGIESNIEWIPQTENKLLCAQNVAKTRTNDLLLNSKSPVQIGWALPPKQDIDTVDGSIKPQREGDNFHNFAENMESKSTPVKSAEFVNINHSEINKQANETPKKLDISSNSTIKAKERTCDFLKNSANKFVNLVHKINSKDKFRNKLFQKDASCQTSNISLHDNSSKNDTNDNKTKPNLFNHTNKNTYLGGFDFNRKITSPKSHRRLSFSPKKIMKNFSQKSSNNILENRKDLEFYKSYQKDYNEDFSLNLMNDILLNIKAKLEASDRHATKVFEEVEKNEKLRALHCKKVNVSGSSQEFNANNYGKITLENVEVHNSYGCSNNLDHIKDIYSEIEEEKIIFSGSPSVRSLDEISHFYVNNDPNSEYAEVKKIKVKSCRSSDLENNYPILSPKASIPENKLTYADIEINPDYLNKSCDVVKYGKCKLTLKENEKCSEGMNNAVDMEDISQIPVTELCVPKTNSPECSSNFSRNAINSVRIFESSVVENQTRPVKELVDYFEHSLCCNATCNPSKLASYESPNGSTNFETEISDAFQELDSVACTSENIYYEIVDQKEKGQSCLLAEEKSKRDSELGKNSSFTSASFDYRMNKSFEGKKYSILKRKFRKSISKGKSLFKNKFQNYSPNDTVNSYDPWEQSNLGITKLFAEDDDESLQKQLEKAVFICRKIPLLQNTIEAVEAERLLLYSALKIENLKNAVSDKTAVNEKPSTDYESWICIKDFELPIKSDIDFIDFFNFFYVGVFSNGHKIISTNYAEKRDKLIIFRNCGVNFENINCDTKIVCDIYVLRLRKVLSTKLTKEQVKAKMEEINGFSDSDEQLLSRFKFQGSFHFFPHNFTPLKVKYSNDKELESLNKFCLHSISTVNLPTETESDHSVILKFVNVTAELEFFFNKFILEGFLNVRRITSEHDWNKCWCKVDNFNFLYWDYPQDCNNKPPMFICNMIECVNEKIEIASQEICPRPKSFSIKLKNDSNLTRNIYFSADNQNDLNYWLNGLNKILTFKNKWM